jgi:hypothetical protein
MGAGSSNDVKLKPGNSINYWRKFEMQKQKLPG